MWEISVRSSQFCHKPKTSLLKALALKNNFVYLFLAVLGLCCCKGFSLVVESEGYSLAAAGRLLAAAGRLLAAVDRLLAAVGTLLSVVGTLLTAVGRLLIAAGRLLAAVASPVAEHGLPGTQASVAAARGPRGCGSWAPEHRPNSYGAGA